MDLDWPSRFEDIVLRNILLVRDLPDSCPLLNVFPVTAGVGSVEVYERPCVSAVQDPVGAEDADVRLA